MTLILTVVIVALVFEYINGFHDTANSIATVVSTKVLTPRQAIFLASITNLIGALIGTAVAKTIASGLVDAKWVDSQYCCVRFWVPSFGILSLGGLGFHRAQATH